MKDDELFGFGKAVLSKLEEISRNLSDIQRLLSAPGTQPSAEADRAVSDRDRKNAVSDRMFREKAPEMVDLLLREGCKSTGMRSPALASELAISKETVLRIARRIMEEEGVLHVVPNSGRGGQGSVVRITGRRFEEAQKWAEALRSTNGSSNHA
jgi:antitoxin component HigA of HigAB toxin-antitoxin module